MDSVNCENFLTAMNFTSEEEIALTQFLVRRYPTIAEAALRISRYRPIPSDAVRLICDAYGYSMDEVAAPGGKRENPYLAQCRATIIDLLNHPNLFNMSRVEISHWFLGNRDNSTVIYIWKHHGYWQGLYLRIVEQVCQLVGRDFHETRASLEAIHGHIEREATAYSTSSRPARV